MANGLPPAQTDQQIANQATTEVNQQVGAQVAPINTQIGDLQGDQTAALSALDKMFSSVQPAVDASAQRLEDFYGQSMDFEKEVFGAATQQLNQLRQHEAVKAQTMAQELGAPVSLSDFTYGIDAFRSIGANQGAAELMHSNAYATAGVGEVESFAGRVFPLMRKEETVKTLNYFQQQITDARKEIARIKSTAPGLISQREADLKIARQDYIIRRFTALKDAENARAAQALDRQRVANDKRNLDLQEAQTLGYVVRKYKDAKGVTHYRKVPTLAAKAAKLDVRKTVDQENADQAVIDDRKRTQDRLDREETRAQQETNSKLAITSGQLLQQATHPSPGATVTRTTQIFIAPYYTQGADKKQIQAAAPAKYDGIGTDPTTGKKGYFVFKDIKGAAPPAPAISDPNQAFRYLTSQGIPNAIAAKTVRDQFNLGDKWKPSGGKFKWTEGQLSGLSFVDLRKIAVSKGFTPDPKSPKTAKQLRQYILNHQ